VDKKIAVVSYKKSVEFTLQNSLGLTILQSRGIFTRGYWYWLGAAALVGYIVVFNILVTFALGYFERKLKFSLDLLYYYSLSL
jgi:hypothetical protein